jgi:hypothetical protein
MPDQIEPHSYAVLLQTYEKFLGKCDLGGIRGRVLLTRYSLNKRWGKRSGVLPPGQEEAQSSLFHPRPGVFKCECPMSVLAHSFRACGF